MTAERVVRRLAAILAADVVGYSRLMGRDENGTLAKLKAHRTERLEPILARHTGRLVKLTGDGALVEFPSAVDALSAAIAFQQAVAEANHDQPQETRIMFRIGLHLGDLIVEGDDLHGDGVNVAAGGSPMQDLLNYHAFRAGRRFKLRIRLNGTDLMCQMVEKGIGLAILPETAARRSQQSMAIRVIPLTDTWALRHLRICVRSFKSLPAHAQRLVEFLRLPTPMP
ncbi:Adenylate and Guanylate cyclase catalytic domain-containing protein [Rhodospirillales bacterium URHD0017]|nr:Adenylate and Guanylate cyclase catalytic domain-containing protein [Rhodospirillales bacterium URHD0017]